MPAHPLSRTYDTRAVTVDTSGYFVPVEMQNEMNGLSKGYMGIGDQDEAVGRVRACQPLGRGAQRVA